MNRERFEESNALLLLLLANTKHTSRPLDLKKKKKHKVHNSYCRINSAQSRNKTSIWKILFTTHKENLNIFSYIFVKKKIQNFPCVVGYLLELYRFSNKFSYFKLVHNFIS